MAATTFVSCRGCNRFGVISKMIVSALALFYVTSAIVYCGKIDDDEMPRTVTLTPTAHSCPFGTLPVSKNAKRGNDKCAESKDQLPSNNRCPGKVCACGKSDIAQAEGCGLEKTASFMEVEAPIVIISDSVDKEATESNEGASPTASKCIPREIESPDVRYNRLVKSIPGSLRPRVLKYPTIEALPGYLVDLISYHFVQKRYERLLPVLPKSIIKDIMPYSRMCQIPRDLFNELSTYIIKKIDFDLGYDPALIAARYERLRYQLPESLARQIPEDGEIALHDALAYDVVRFLIKGIVKVFPDLYTDRSLTAFAGNPEAPFKRRIFFYSDMLLIGKTMERYSLKTYSDDEPRRIF